MKKLFIVLISLVIIGAVGFSYILNVSAYRNERKNQNAVSQSALNTSNEENTMSEDIELMESKEYTIEEMLIYAIEDEYKARAEYEKIIEVFGEQRPFTNIVKAEKVHIDMLEPLFKEYNITIPDNDVSNKVIIPETIEKALEIGIEAEIYNIDMYEKFLSHDLPEDIKSTFTYLKNASQNHLSAFERGTQRGNR